MEKGLAMTGAVQHTLVNFGQYDLAEAGITDLFFLYSGDESEVEKLKSQTRTLRTRTMANA